MARLFALAAVLGMTLASGIQAEVKVGDKAPDFELQGTDGKVHKTSDYIGKKPVVIAWFPKAKTKGCTIECKSLKEHSAALKALPIAYFTASVDDTKLNGEFAKDLDLDYPILSDPTKKFSGALGVLNDRGMSNRWTYYIGKDGKIAYIDKEIKTASAGPDVAAKVKELGWTK